MSEEKRGKMGKNGGKWGKMGVNGGVNGGGNGDVDKRNLSHCLPLHLPLLYAVARRVLAVPATSCDVERCFSSLKWVRDERQRSMKCDTHRAAVMLHYNGIPQ